MASNPAVCMFDVGQAATETRATSDLSHPERRSRRPRRRGSTGAVRQPRADGRHVGRDDPRLAYDGYKIADAGR